MLRIAPARRRALVEEYRAAPLGPHSAEMQKVLQLLRWSGGIGQPSVVVSVPYREWVIGIPPKRRGEAVVLERDRVFDDIGDAFVAVFERRLDAFLEDQAGSER